MPYANPICGEIPKKILDKLINSSTEYIVEFWQKGDNNEFENTTIKIHKEYALNKAREGINEHDKNFTYQMIVSIYHEVIHLSTSTYTKRKYKSSDNNTNKGERRYGSKR